MRKCISATFLLALAVSAGSARANPAGSWGDDFGHMMWGGGFGMVGGLMMLLFWGAIIALIVLVVRGAFAGPDSGPDSGTKSDSKSDPADILRERYAKGDIDDEEYERRKAKLGL